MKNTDQENQLLLQIAQPLGTIQNTGNDRVAHHLLTNKLLTSTAVFPGAKLHARNWRMKCKKVIPKKVKMLAFHMSAPFRVYLLVLVR
jgi:hypothetical protein